MLAELYEGHFCFIQTENGRVVEVHNEEGSHPEGLNLKKTIAAAFQANFNRKEISEQNPEANFQNQEDYIVYEEQDPQSRHTAHYR